MDPLAMQRNLEQECCQELLLPRPKPLFCSEDLRCQIIQLGQSEALAARYGLLAAPVGPNLGLMRTAALHVPAEDASEADAQAGNAGTLAQGDFQRHHAFA